MADKTVQSEVQRWQSKQEREAMKATVVKAGGPDPFCAGEDWCCRWPRRAIAPPPPSASGGATGLPELLRGPRGEGGGGGGGG
jgi:hypothetical protein